MRLVNGMSATDLPTSRWRKSRTSNPTGSCVEIAELPEQAVALRNSRDKSGPALIYPRTAVGAFLQGVKNGEFDALISLSGPLRATDRHLPGNSRRCPGDRAAIRRYCDHAPRRRMVG